MLLAPSPMCPWAARQPARYDRSMLCARCLTELEPGTGSFYEVRIESVCDPTPPELDDALSSDEIRRQIADTLDQLREVSAQEALDEVRRALTIHLCRACFREWIEDPAGNKERE